MFQPRINNIKYLVGAIRPDFEKVGSELSRVDVPIKSVTHCMPESLAKMYMRVVELPKTVARIPIRQSSELTFKNRGLFNPAKYAKDFESRYQEMQDALYCVENNDIVQKIRETGDLFSFEEVSQIEELVNTGIPLEKAIRCRGKVEQLQVIDGDVKLESETTIRHILEEYVNKLAVFQTLDKNNMFEYTKKINKYIKVKAKYLQDTVLYRGEQSESEINRLLSLILEKQNNPSKCVIYQPNHLYSTTNDLEVLTKDFNYADKCFIKIIGTDGKCKGIDMNEMVGSKNKFFNQKEILLSGTSEFEVVGGEIQDNRLFVTLKFLN